MTDQKIKKARMNKKNEKRREEKRSKFSNNLN